MSLNLIHIEQLILEEIAGVISPENKIVLQKAIAEDPEAYKLWKEKQQLFASPEIMEWLHEEAPEFIKVERSRSPVVKLLLLGTTIAACVLVISLVAGSLLLTEKKPAGSTVENIRHQPFELTFENGEVIDLMEEGKLSAGGVTFIRQEKMLTVLGNNNEIPRLALLKVPVGKDYKVILPDGSAVLLDAMSTFKFPTSFANASKREVFIEGRAYLKVEENANQPFIAQLPGSSVEVLGTSFNVNSFDKKEVTVALVDGKVKFNGGTDSAILLPDTLITYTGEGKIQKRHFDKDELLQWREGVFRFNNKLLEDAFEVVPRWFGQEIVIDDDKKRKILYSGVLQKNMTIEKNLKLLALEHYTDSSNVIHIK